MSTTRRPPMTPEEHTAAVEAIIGRRSEEGDYQAAALATAVAHRIDRRVRVIDAWLTARETSGRVVSLRAWKSRRGTRR